VLVIRAVLIVVSINIKSYHIQALQARHITARGNATGSVLVFHIFFHGLKPSYILPLSSKRQPYTGISTTCTGHA